MPKLILPIVVVVIGYQAELIDEVRLDFGYTPGLIDAAQACFRAMIAQNPGELGCIVVEYVQGDAEFALGMQPPTDNQTLVDKLLVAVAAAIGYAMCIRVEKDINTIDLANLEAHPLLPAPTL